jgi:hypothetical protein
VAGARRFHRMALGSRRIPTFEFGVDGSVFCRYQNPTWFASPRSRGDDGPKIVRKVRHLRARHERGLLSREVGCEVLMKLSGVQVRETVSGLLYCAGLAEVTGKALSVVCLILSGVWHVSSDVHQSGHRRIRSRFSNYGSAIAVSDQNAESILKSEGALRGGHIFFKGCLRLLDDADVIAVLDQNVVDTFPARTICPRAMNQNNIPNAMLLVSHQVQLTQSFRALACCGDSTK